MFERLSRFGVILVSGPQRSGTHICARAIAYDTGHRYIDEMAFAAHNSQRWREIVRAGGRVVVQCPAQCHLLHEWAGDSRVGVVFMRRALKDILASQERINWTAHEGARELAKYGLQYGTIAQVKYDFWERWQRDLFPPGRRFEVEYRSLRDHSLWLPRAKRRGFVVGRMKAVECS